MPGEIAKPVSELSLETKDISKPIAIGKKILGGLEVGIGNAAGAMLHDALTPYLKNEDIAGATQAVAGMLANGMITQTDASNFLSGVASEPFARWGRKILAKLNIGMKPVVVPTGAADKVTTANTATSQPSENYAFQNQSSY